MTFTPAEFRRGMYEEHVEEASFLYQQRSSMVGDAQQSWMAVEPFEQRLEAHLDALVVGSIDAIQVCQERGASGDAGDLFALTALACRLQDASVFASIVRREESGSPARMRAVSDALAQELPPPWNGPLVAALHRSGPRLLPLLARVAGYRRLPAGAVIAEMLRREGQVGVLEMLWAAGRLRDASCLEGIRIRYADPDAAIRRAALRAGLRMKDADAREQVSAEPLDSAMAVLLGLCGDRRAVEPLCEFLLSRPTPGAAIALGLLGEASALPHLAAILEHPDLPLSTAQMTAQALFLITGAALFEEVLQPEPVAEDELFEGELAAYRERGERPRRADGRLFGPVVRRLSIDPGVWTDWLRHREPPFGAAHRYRLGFPDSFSALRAGLSSGVISKPVRELLIDESVVRHDVDLGVEAQMPVAVQRKLLQSH